MSKILGPSLTNQTTNDYQNRDYVLQWVGPNEGEAKSAYRRFVPKSSFRTALFPQRSKISNSLCKEPGSSFEVAFLLMESLMGPETAKEVKKYM